MQSLRLQRLSTGNYSIRIYHSSSTITTSLPERKKNQEMQGSSCGKLGFPHFSQRTTLHKEGLQKQETQEPSYGKLGFSCEQLGFELETLCREGQLDMAIDTLSRMDHMGINPPHHIYLPLMKACIKRKALTHAKQVHAHLAQHKLELNSLLGEHLVLTLARCGGLDDACHVFHRLPHRTVLSWTAMISGYTESGRGSEALELYQCMQEDDVEPNQYTFVSLLKACGSILDLETGRKLHEDVRRKGLMSNVFIGSILVSMYGKCGSIVDAENVFKEFSQLNSVSWNTMLSAYAEQGQGERALQLYRQMQSEGVGGDERTFAIVLQACGSLVDKKEGCDVEGRLGKVMFLEIGRALHAGALRKGFASIMYVGNTLVSMYGKFGRIVEAENVFNGLSERNVVSWSVMLSAYVEQGHGERALHLYRRMQEEGVRPDERTFVIALQACGRFLEKEETTEDGKINLMSLEIGQALHADADRKGLSSHVFVANTLVSMYGKCGSIAEAENMFGWLSEGERTVVSWNAMLSAYVERGLGEKCLQLYRQMQEEGVRLDQRTYVIALQACGIFVDKGEAVIVDKGEAVIVEGGLTKVVCKDIVQALHTDVWRKGFVSDTFVCSTLVRMYGKCGKLEDVERMFVWLCKNDVKVWNAMLLASVEHGEGEKALQLYRQMQEEGVDPNQQTFMIAFQSCCTLAEKEEAIVVEGQPIKVVSLKVVKALHVDAENKGFASDVFVVNTLLSVYGKCGAIVEAETVFDGLSHRNVVSWNVMLSVYVEEGKGGKALQFCRQMHEEGVNLNELTFMVSFQACGLLAVKEESLVEGGSIKLMPLEIGRALHADALRKGFSFKSFVGNTLMSMYGKCGSTRDAENVFTGLSQYDVVSWSVMLSAYVEQGQGEEALQLYTRMQKEGIAPDDRTFVVALQACGSIAEKGEAFVVENQLTKAVLLEIGQALHADALKRGFTSNVYVGNTLVSMYGKCGSVLEAENVFSGLSKYDVVSWSAMLSAYVEQGQCEKALCLYKEMQELRVNPDKWTLVIVLQACGIFGEKEEAVVVDEQSTKVMSLKICQALHADALKKGFAEDSLVASILVSTYGKCGRIVDAANVFDRLPQSKVMSSNAMLSAYVEQGQADKALQLYRLIMRECMPLDDTTFVWVLQACSDLGSMEVCRQLHFMIVSSKFDLSPLLAASLAHAYGSCASMADAQAVFNGLAQPDVVLWSACIAGYAQDGDCCSSLQMLSDMLLAGVNPNRVTFLLLLSACNHAGLVDIGIKYFESMSKDYSIAPDLKHYAAMVELLGRAGDFARVGKILLGMPMQADLAIWLCLLGACHTHGNVEMGKKAFGRAVHSHPKEAAAYVLMSNIYADARMQDLAYEVGNFIKSCKKRAWLEDEQEVHSYTI